ncbi:class I SAM-dependent methyltransferase [Pseudarthrobacter sulfonivorans]|uniref:class I SAM-dependent methyltransferase n=1 Tax=Pseudarthrobacter sulfonivorans TaxID=121292 RepID=UPI002106AE52|nr:class I SAM-dependent methyltransferase [Pseudarthrobacter sulfonivorans]
MTELEDRGLPLTALAVAAGRAVETSRADGLITDPFALALVEAARSHVDFPTSWPTDPEAASPLQQPLLLASIYIAVRTRFIDDFLQSAPPTTQTVLLGAGLDTRAYRLPWPDGARVFEIDHANVLEFKAGVLGRLSAQPACALVTVATDLALPWREPLTAAGFDPDQPMTELLARADPPDPLELLGAEAWRCAAHSVQELCLTYNRVLSLSAPGESTEAQPASGQSRGGFVTALR